METLLLEEFIIMSQEKSINKAAKRLNMTTSNLTVHLNKLEEYAGTQLFVRSKKGKGLTITENGKTLLSIAQNIVSLCNTFKKQCNDDKRITIGIDPVYGFKAFFNIIEEFKKKNPEFTIEFNADYPYFGLSEQLPYGYFDLFFGYEEKNYNDNLIFHPLIEEPLYIAVKAGTFAQRKINLSEIGNLRVFVDNAKAYRFHEVLSALKDNNASLDIQEEMALSLIGIELSKGDCCVIVPDSFRFIFESEFDMVMINDYSVRLGAYTHVNSQKIRKLLDYIKKNVNPKTERFE